MGWLAAIKKMLNDRASFDSPASAPVVTGDIVFVQDEEIRVLSYGTPADGDVWQVDSSDPRGWSLAPQSGGGGGGDNITVNTTAATDADFNDTTPAAPAGNLNVKFQIDTTTTPDKISGYVPIPTLSPLLVAATLYGPTGAWQTHVFPAHHRFFRLSMQGAGAGGAGGESQADGNLRQGGGGGSAGARTVSWGRIDEVCASHTVFIDVPFGGLGGAIATAGAQPLGIVGNGGLCVVSALNNTNNVHHIMYDAGAIAGAGNAATGLAGTPAAIFANGTRYHEALNWTPRAGAPATAGGNGVAGATLTPANFSVTGGAGGGGRSATNVNFAGGGIVASGAMAAVAAGVLGAPNGGNGGNGVATAAPDTWTGGAGGGGGVVGGNGGNGALGCGGGGGGGGQTGGTGGNGGNGWVLVESW